MDTIGPDDRSASTSPDLMARVWLTTVVGRVCTDKLRARLRARLASLHAPHAACAPHASPAGSTISSLRDPEFDGDFGTDLPAHHAALAEAATAALLGALAAMPPEQRLAFALHDVFALDPDEVAEALGGTPEQVAVHVADARRRLRGD